MAENINIKQTSGEKAAKPPNLDGSAMQPGTRLPEYPKGCILLSLLSWPEPSCPKNLKPALVMAAALIWCALMILATVFNNALQTILPIYTMGLMAMMAGFISGSVISVMATALYLIAFFAGLFTVQLPEVMKDLIGSGYKKSIIVWLLLAWLYGVPHWRRKFSWIFTLVWGLIVFFGPLAYFLAKIYGFYGHLPPKVIEHFLKIETMLSWLLTVVLAAVISKLFYIIKDRLRKSFCQH